MTPMWQDLKPLLSCTLSLNHHLYVHFQTSLQERFICFVHSYKRPSSFFPRFLKLSWSMYPFSYPSSPARTISGWIPRVVYILCPIWPHPLTHDTPFCDSPLLHTLRPRPQSSIKLHITHSNPPSLQTSSPHSVCLVIQFPRPHDRSLSSVSE